MTIVKATKDTEAGVMPKEDLLGTMAKSHEELAKTGALLDGSTAAQLEGLPHQVDRRQAPSWTVPSPALKGYHLLPSVRAGQIGGRADGRTVAA
jgi:hypothetical protein